MAREYQLTRVASSDPTNINPGLPITYRQTDLDGSLVKLQETSDFPYDDPWSELTRSYINWLAGNERFRDNDFAGRDIVEAGIGDARNILTTGTYRPGEQSKVIGIDLDDWRLEAGRHNLQVAGIAEERLRLHHGDVVEWLKDTRDEPRLRGWGFACLPQAPETATENDADGYGDIASLQDFKDRPLGGHTVDDFGLTLNAAFLDGLRKRVQPGDFRLLITLAGRVPREVLDELFSLTGWEYVEHRQARAVQQDPDTGLAWVRRFDDGDRFLERTPDGNFAAITAVEAEERRLASLEQYGSEARQVLNVYHELSVYQLQPKFRIWSGYDT